MTPPDVLARSVTDEVLAVLRADKDIQTGSQKKVVDLVEKKVLPHFNFVRMTQLAVGRHWREASPEQQKLLVGEFRTLLVQTYAATFTAPATGPLYLTIKSSFGASNLRLYPAPIIAAGATAPTVSLVDRGRALFVAKGCNACHTNGDLVDRPDNQQIKAGPELGGHRLARDYVIQKMKSPASETMPDLGLSEAEVAAIATFLAGESSTATGR